MSATQNTLNTNTIKSGTGTFPLNLVTFVLNSIITAYQDSLPSLIWILIRYYVLYLLIKFVIKSFFRGRWEKAMKKKWQAVAEKKRNQTRTRFKQVRNLIDALNDDNPKDLPEDLKKALPYASVGQFHHYLLSGQLSCVQLLNFFFKRAVDIGLEHNLLTEPLYDFALSLAKKRDEELQVNLQAKKWTRIEQFPPLFGIPVTLKDQFQIKGADTTLGVSARAFTPEKETGLAARLIIEAGGVPFAKTNMPQMFLAIETNNLIFGSSINPWNKERTTGGSSGGEAALAALGASVLGFGSDSSGSCRIPTNFCGVYGMKPTSRRFTYKGISDPPFSDAMPDKALSFGPISHNVENLERGLKAFLNAELLRGEEFVKLGAKLSWDASRVYNIENKQKLRIGVVTAFNEFGVTKTQARAIQEVSDKLKAVGHEIVDFNSTRAEFSNLVKGYLRVATSGQGKPIDKVLQGEATIPEFSKGDPTENAPFWFKKYIAKILESKGQKRLSELVLNMKNGSATENLGVLRKLIFEAREKIFKKYRDLKLDAMITPGIPVPAYRLGTQFIHILRIFRFFTEKIFLHFFQFFINFL